MTSWDDIAIPDTGSSKDVWKDYALHMLQMLADTHAALHHAHLLLADETEKRFLLQEQLAARKPKGRPALPPETVSAIAAATGSTRKIASRFGVSAMAVSRIKRATLEAKANSTP